MARQRFEELQEGYDLPHRYRQRQRLREGGHRKRDFALAASLAVATASIIGLMAFDRSAGGPIAGQLAAIIGDMRLAAAGPKGGESVVRKKAIATATLVVEDATARPGAPVALSLKSEGAAPLDIRLTGLPTDAYLTAGTRIDDAAWLLKRGEEQDVKLVLPKGFAAQATLTVAAIEPVTGELAAPAQELSISASPPAGIPGAAGEEIIIPVAAAPELQSPAGGKANLKDLLFGRGNKDIAIISAPPPRAADPHARTMMANGDTLMKAGEIAGARQFYQRALDLGQAEAAFKLGQTYDPRVFAAKNVRGPLPDAAKAAAYYAQARAAGVAEADASLAALKAETPQ